MYKPAKENDQAMMGKLIGIYKKAYTAIAITVGIIGLVLSFFWEYIVSEPPHIPESMQVIFLLYIINNVASYLLAYKKSILIAYQDNYIISYVSQATSILQQLLQMAILLTTHQYYLYLMVQIGCTVLNNIVVAVVVKIRYPWLSGYANEKLPQSVSNSIFENVKALSISKIAGVISNGSDNIIISKLLGLASVGLVSNYTMIINAANSVLWSGLSNITSSFGNFNVDSTIERKRSLFNEIYLCSYWLYGFLTVCIVTLINPFIELWIGSEYLIPQNVVIALILNTYVSGVNFPIYTYQTTLGMYKKMKYSYVMFGVSNVILSIILGLKIGLVGIYLATSISRICTSELAGGYYVYHDGLELSPWKYAIKYIISFVFLIINILISSFAVSMVEISGILGFSIKLIVCVCVCNIFYGIVFSKTEEYRCLKYRVTGLIKRRKM